MKVWPYSSSANMIFFKKNIKRLTAIGFWTNKGYYALRKQMFLNLCY